MGAALIQEQPARHHRLLLRLHRFLQHRCSTIRSPSRKSRATSQLHRPHIPQQAPATRMQILLVILIYTATLPPTLLYRFCLRCSLFGRWILVFRRLFCWSVVQLSLGFQITCELVELGAVVLDGGIGELFLFCFRFLLLPSFAGSAALALSVVAVASTFFAASNFLYPSSLRTPQLALPLLPHQPDQLSHAIVRLALIKYVLVLSFPPYVKPSKSKPVSCTCLHPCLLQCSRRRGHSPTRSRLIST